MNWPLSEIEPGIVLIVGPTATGKTDLSINLARRWGCEVVSADAFQVYRGFDIGTAKVSSEVLAEIPHHCVDVCHPADRFSVGAFQSIVTPIIQAAQSTETPLLICGGTGLYIQTVLFEYVFPSVPTDPVLRDSLNHELARHGTPWMWQKLAKLDPKAADGIHPNHNRRIVRALEICMLTGKALHDARSQSKQRTDVTVIGLCVDPATHWQWIRNRIIQMVSAGFIDEVIGLRNQVGTDVPAFKAVGYPETVAYLDGMINTQDELIDQIAIRTRQLAKRQLTWFKRLAHVKWIEIG